MKRVVRYLAGGMRLVQRFARQGPASGFAYLRVGLGRLLPASCDGSMMNDRILSIS